MRGVALHRGRNVPVIALQNVQELATDAPNLVHFCNLKGNGVLFRFHFGAKQGIQSPEGMPPVAPAGPAGDAGHYLACLEQLLASTERIVHASLSAAQHAQAERALESEARRLQETRHARKVAEMVRARAAP